MLEFPRLKAHLTLVVIDHSHAFLSSDVESWNLDGPVLPRLAQMLDGTRSVATILDELRGTMSPAEVLGALAILRRDGHLDDESRRGRSSARARSVRLSTTQVLHRLGLRPRKNGDLLVLPTDAYFRSEPAALASEQERTDRAWMPVKSSGTVFWVGPIVHPPATPCWQCVVGRLRANQQVHTPVGLTETRWQPAPALRAFSVPLSDLRTSSRRYLRPLLQRGIMIAVDPITWRSSRHVVVRDPECPCCGKREQDDSGLAADSRIILVSRRRIAGTDGGWRTTSPESTFARYRHHISKWTGIVRRLTRRSAGPGGLELYSAEHAFLTSASPSFPTGSRRSSGKGVSRAQARASALCEALERYSGVFRGTEARVHAAYDELADAAVHPNACAAFSESQFDHRAQWNGRSSPTSWVPPRLDRRHRIDWTPVWSLTHERVRYVPTAYCYYGYGSPAQECCSRADSNGCAAGNSLEEAILHGFLELVERDAVAIWWYNEIKRPQVELRSLANPFFRRMTREYERIGRSITVFELTTDLGIPVFAAASEVLRPGLGGLLLGFGAHFEVTTAISRAMTELNQWRTGVDLGVAGQSFSHQGPGLGRFLRQVSASDVRRRRDFEHVDYRDIRNAVDACVLAASRCGLETLVLNQTRRDVGLPVVRVIVPGLRHFWPRFGPGRLYQVPVVLGWRKRPRAESDLNKFHIAI